MAEASKTAELSSQPTKRGRRAWLIGLAVVIAVLAIVLLANAPKPEPVKVWFVRAANYPGTLVLVPEGVSGAPAHFTNAMASKQLVFEGTNGSSRAIAVIASVVAGGAGPAKTPADLRWTHDSRSIVSPAQARFEFALSAPRKDVAYYIDWVFYDTAALSTRWGRSRIAWSRFFIAHHMPRLASLFAFRLESHYIPSTEIKE